MTSRSFFALVSVLALAAPARGAAQGTAPAGGSGPSDWDPQRVLATRESLRDLEGRLTLAAQSPAYSDRLRGEARAQAQLIRQRLADGDFQVGDRILLAVEGERDLTDTFTVGPQRAITLPLVGQVALAGVLRSELEPALHTALAKYYRDPVAHARALMPVSILGEIARPGFYTVPTEARLTDVLMLAGGPGRDAQLDRIRIERDGRSIWEGQALQQGITEGMTLDQLSVRAGDHIMVPSSKRSDLEKTTRVLFYLLSLPAAVIGVSRVF
jgi:protein involved in polysaccharide export with SLBB domain